MLMMSDAAISVTNGIQVRTVATATGVGVSRSNEQHVYTIQNTLSGYSIEACCDHGAATRYFKPDDHIFLCGS